MNEEDLLERLDFLEYRQDLLFENTDVSRLLFEGQVTRYQYKEIMDLMDDYRKKIGNKEKVHSGTFEKAIYRICPQHDADYHFAEAIAQEHHRCGRWEEVFEALYGDMPKFQSYLIRKTEG